MEIIIIININNKNNNKRRFISDVKVHVQCYM